MRVVHVLGAFLPGGAEVYVRNLTVAIKRKYPEADIQIWGIYDIADLYPGNETLLKFQEAFIEKLRENNISYLFLKRRPLRDRYLTIKKLRWLYLRNKPNVIHAHLEGVLMYTVLALKRFKVPLVTTIHNTVIRYPLLNRFLLLPRVSKVVAISQKVYDILKNDFHVSKERLCLIYNGINLAEIKRYSYDVRKTVKKVIAVGRLEEQKDHETLLRAYKLFVDRLQRQGYDVPELIIVGTGSLREKLQKLTVELGINNHVNFLGVKENVCELLSISDIYVMSSKWEGLSISLMEALAIGIPIIATNVGSNNEIVQDGVNGVLLPPQNPALLAEYLEKLYHDYELRKRFSKAAIESAEKFDINVAAEKHWHLYNALVKKS